MPSWAICILLLAFGASGVSFGSAAQAPAPSPAANATLRILFMGNSLSFYNNGTYKVVAHLLSQQFPDTAIEAVQIAEPDEILSEHLAKALTPGTFDYQALGPASTEHWDFVILQEESQQVALGGHNAIGTRDAIASLAKLAAARGARVGVVLTWAWLDGANKDFPSFEAMQDQVNGGYVDLVQQVRKVTGIPVFLAPIGLAWQAVHSILSEEAADQQLQNSTRAASDLANITDPTGDIDLSPGAPEAAPESANATSQTNDSNGNSSASALPMSTSSSSSAAVASFVAEPSAPLAAGEAPVQSPPVPEVNLALVAAICGPRPAPAAPAPAPEAPVAVTAQPVAPAAAAAAHVMPDLIGGLAYTTGAAGRKLLHQTAPGYSRCRISVGQQERAESTLASRHGARRTLQVALAKPATAAPAVSAASQGQPAALPPTALITRVNASAAIAPAPVPEITVPDVDHGERVRQEVSVPSQSAPAPSPSSQPAGDKSGKAVDICKEGNYPSGWDTFKQMYDTDGNHPSEEGTYLEGLIIASAMTGCSMQGNQYSKGVDDKWVGFLQSLSDAVMFRTTPPAFPQQLWLPQGAKCTLL